MRTFLLNLYDYLVLNLSSPDWQKFIFTLKIISLIISALLLAAVILLIIRLRKQLKKSFELIAESISAPGLPKKKMVKRWESVLANLGREDENSYKLAVIEADKIFDDILKKIGYQGEDMGERLKQLTPAQTANLDEVWQAHKLRNQIVHEPDSKLTRAQAQRAVEIYQRALEDLEAV
ncbi:MAG: hypothetical protein COS49_00240 [Candidatus Portnoybacteria bacterium CG03_land_8_20_14_0_80_41_10]|uniref:DUF4145 domain-containing protein n=1 Tax=Candidatus Portnoybacteria bacterium CG03_land_8_20_14_0_80_41_10 TaxID=1974808 RepID=A0A2M7BVB4_9BACT|nr:MAG: hypothetical protein COS49_00240 [Candidatus Portnoybacteria bacterium CG03_land_8_20_14_0_80_41_10]